MSPSVQREEEPGGAACFNARTIANRLKSFSYIYTRSESSESTQRSLLQFRLAATSNSLYYQANRAKNQNRLDSAAAAVAADAFEGHHRRLSMLSTYSRYYHQYQYQNQLNNYFNQSVVYYNNLILVLVILFIIFTVLVLLEDTEHPYYNLSTIIFLLLLLFNLIILVFAHNFAKQFLLSKNLVYYR